MENKNFIDRNPFLHKVYHNSFLAVPLHKVKQYGFFIKYKSEAITQYLQTIPRILGIKDRRFIPLKAYKNKYKGKRVFITCTGPSLTIEDLEKLQGEYVFGMNSICLIHDKTNWKPDFYGIQDAHVFDKIKEPLLATDNGVVFAPYQYYARKNTPSNWVYFHLSGSYHLYEMVYGPRYFAKFSNDCYKTVYDGYSITYSIMQLAMYMGFSEIYLLGADCNYLGQKQHFIETGHYDPGAQYASDRMFASYKVAKQYADTHGIRMYNATRGGYLEIFERVNLEDVLLKNEKNKGK